MDKIIICVCHCDAVLDKRTCIVRDRAPFPEGCKKK